MDKQFKRILDLVRRTGDRMIVTDADGNEAYVVMDLTSYEALLDMEDAVIDRLSSEETAEESIAMGEDPGPPADIWEAMPPAGSATETWDIEAMKPQEKAEVERQFRSFQGQRPAAAPQNRQNSAEASQKIEKPKDEDFGEEQFYLEPIE